VNALRRTAPRFSTTTMLGAAALVGIAASACSAGPADRTGSGSAAVTAARPAFAAPLATAKIPSPSSGSGGGGVKPQDLGFSKDPMTGDVHMYFIMYGDWSDSSWSPNVIYQLAGDIGGTPYLDLLSTWNAATMAYGPYAQSWVYDVHTGPILLDDAGVQGVVTSNIAAHGWANDPQGVYFVLAGDNVNVIDAGQNLSFCSNMCGYHQATASGLKYAWIGNPKHCGPAGQTGGCFVYQPYLTDANSPHRDLVGDSMAFVTAHELIEAITDPYPNLNQFAQPEVADVCASTLPQEYWLDSGHTTLVNIVFNPGQSIQNAFLLPAIDVDAGSGYCAIAPPAAPSCTISQAACGRSGVSIVCNGVVGGDITGVVQFQRDGVTFSTTQQSDTVYPLWPHDTTTNVDGLTDTTAGQHTWRVCSGDGKGGLLCTTPATLSNPSPACCQPPPRGCPKKTSWNQDDCQCEADWQPPCHPICQ